MSRRVREWLREMELYYRTVHSDRVKIDEEIEKRTGIHCDTALERGLISREEFRRIVEAVIKKRREEEQKEQRFRKDAFELFKESQKKKKKKKKEVVPVIV